MNIKNDIPKCPNCNKRLAKIIYGFPTEEMFEQAEKQEVYLGGCTMIIGEEPIYHCYRCDRNFYEDLNNKLIEETKK